MVGTGAGDGDGAERQFGKTESSGDVCADHCRSPCGSLMPPSRAPKNSQDARNF